MSLAYYTNIIEGLPDRFRFRKMQVNLFHHIEDHEGYPRNRPHPPSDSDDNSGHQEFPSGSYSADSDQLFRIKRNLMRTMILLRMSQEIIQNPLFHGI